VIMVGEIRDHETADIAIHASLTGHLVLSTLHTNDAPMAVIRLVDMGIKPFQISSSVMAILAQRLVRRLCPFCRVPYVPKDADLRELGLDDEDMTAKLEELKRVAATTVIGNRQIGEDLSLPDLAYEELEPDATQVFAPSRGVHFYRPGACEECSQTGYRGRIGIYELLVVDEAIRRAILNGSDAKTMQRIAQQSGGMRILREDGARQVLAGVTSVEEVLAATQAEGLD